MKKRFTILLILLFAFTGLTQAQSLTVGEAIAKAGGQRMLAQRIMKCYLMIGSDVRTAQARKELDVAVSLFEEQMLELQDYVPNEKIGEAIMEAQELWMAYRVKVVSEPNRFTASVLLPMSDDLVKECNDVVELLERHAKVKGAKLVNLSGRQRMLSQRIAMLYVAYCWRVPNADVYRNLKKANKEFEKTLGELVASPLNTAAITKGLNEAIIQWEYSKNTFDVKNAQEMPAIITVTTNSILEKMDDITGMYAKLVTN